nr:hypothetical protein Iba_scaffold34464CG0010 [Ipomoea batatas]GMC77576.1 hypothetical protein Iba_scaffold34656CG0010 [Ipomoea batatas]
MFPLQICQKRDFCRVLRPASKLYQWLGLLAKNASKVKCALKKTMQIKVYRTQFVPIRGWRFSSHHLLSNTRRCIVHISGILQRSGHLPFRLLHQMENYRKALASRFGICCHGQYINLVVKIYSLHGQPCQVLHMHPCPLWHCHPRPPLLHHHQLRYRHCFPFLDRHLLLLLLPPPLPLLQISHSLCKCLVSLIFQSGHK